MYDIQELPIFKGLDQTSVGRIESAVEVVSFGDDITLFRQGDAADAFYIIQEGAIRVVREDGGHKTELAVLQKGNFFGEMGLLDDSTRSATCITKGDTSLLVISKEAFLKMMATNPTISRHVMSALVKRACKAREVPMPGIMEDTQTGVPSIGNKGVIVGLFSASGGVGTTFLAANLAYTLAEQTGAKVLVADLDLMFGDQGVMFDILPDRSIQDLIGIEELDTEQLLDAVMSTKTKVDILQAPKHPENAEAIDGGMIIQILEKLRSSYDYIICDTAHVVQDFNIHVLEMVQVPIYVLTPDLFGLKNCARWYDLMRKIKYDVSKVEYLINKYEKKDSHTIEWLYEKFEKKPVALVPYDLKTVKDSVDSGQLLALEESDSPVSESLKEVAAMISGTELVDESKSSWWKKWIPI
jgi:pilus assembly protein CpaE